MSVSYSIRTIGSSDQPAVSEESHQTNTHIKRSVDWSITRKLPSIEDQGLTDRVLGVSRNLIYCKRIGNGVVPKLFSCVEKPLLCVALHCDPRNQQLHLANNSITITTTSIR